MNTTNESSSQDSPSLGYALILLTVSPHFTNCYVQQASLKRPLHSLCLYYFHIFHTATCHHQLYWMVHKCQNHHQQKARVIMMNKLQLLLEGIGKEPTPRQYKGQCNDIESFMFNSRKQKPFHHCFLVWHTLPNP